jgi:hypothetical protein
MKLPTGIETLDRKLGGGLPPGTLVVVTAPPGTQHDPLVCAGTGERSSLFFTTVKNEPAVHKMLEQSPVSTDVQDVEELEPDRTLEVVPEKLETLDQDQDFYLDVVDPIEADLSRDAYLDFLNGVSERLDAVGTTGYLYGYRTDDEPRNRRYTLDVADFVINLGTSQQRSKLKFALEIPKANGIRMNEDDRYLDIAVGRQIDVDETRNI